MKYKVYYTAHMCDHIEIEAECYNDARELAYEKAYEEHPESDHMYIDEVVSLDDESTNSTHNYHAS